MTGFWSSETMRSRFVAERLIAPFDPRRIENCAYELGMGPQALLTGEKKIRHDLGDGEQLRIPPGHFAQLLTEEIVRIPPDSLGLISMKSSVKSLGLVNVSGFHVDPGFQGRLRFSVYNAGPSPVSISRGTPTFLIWLASLDSPTRDLYSGDGGRSAFNDKDSRDMEGDIFTPHVLADRVVKLEQGVNWRHQIWHVLVAAVLGGLITLGLQTLFERPDPSPMPGNSEPATSSAESQP